MSGEGGTAEGPAGEGPDLGEDFRTLARARFAALARLGDEDLPLDKAAAWMAAEEQPDADVPAMLADLDGLAARLSVRQDADVFERCARLVHLLFVDQGFAGDEDDYHHVDNSLLNAVLQRRRGMPILLSLVTIEVGRRAGIEIHGIGFPGHFLVRPALADPPFYLDPFHGGRVVRQAELELQLSGMGGAGAATAGAWLAPVTARQLLVRINHNLKHSHVQQRDVHGVLRACERLLLLDPGLLGERRDRALLLGQLGRTRAAIDELEFYLGARPEAPEGEQLRRHLAKLSERLAQEGGTRGGPGGAEDAD